MMGCVILVLFRFNVPVDVGDGLTINAQWSCW